jgi:mycothiol synthase
VTHESPCRTLHSVPTALPAPLTSRPLRPTDLEEVFRVVVTSEMTDVGEALVERSDISADWNDPATDLALDSRGVFDGEELVAVAEVHRGGRRAEVAVVPDRRGCGIGSWLAAWTERRAAALGAERVGQAVPHGSAPHRFLVDRGYEVAWTSWVLVLPDGAAVPDRGLPTGYRLATADAATHRDAYHVVEDAFGEWDGREHVAYEGWASHVVERPGFEPWMLRLVVHDADGVVGVCFTRVDEEGTGFVGQLAVQPGHRGRGLAQVLLADGFAGARDHGAVRSELTTDSRTGALDLYLKVGMRVTSTWLNLATDPRVAVSR